MATITGITAERAATIENAIIVSAEVRSGQLIFTTRGGSEIPAGAVMSKPFQAYPIGSIFMTVNPGAATTILQGGTWIRWGQGRVPVGVTVDTPYALFDAVEEQGGALKIPNAALPSHTHTMQDHYHSINHDHPAHSAGLIRALNADSPLRQFKADFPVDRDVMGYVTTSVVDIVVDLPDFGGSSGYIAGGAGETGVGPAINNDHMPPYITCYMWKRTA